MKQLLLLPLLATGVEAQLDPRCTLGNEHFGVELVRQERCCPSRLTLLVEKRGTGELVERSVEAGVRRIENLRILDPTTLLISGHLAGGGRSFVVVDLGSDAVDEIRSYGYQISPARRYLAHVTYFPPDTPEPERRSLLLLYDFARSPAENRAGTPATLDSSNAGIPLYPERNALAGSYGLDLESRHRFLSPLLWAEDESSLVFFTAVGGRFELVRLLLTEDGPPVTRRRAFTREELLPGASAQSATGPAVVSLRFDGEASVALELRGAGGVRRSAVVALPE